MYKRLSNGGYQVLLSKEIYEREIIWGDMVSRIILSSQTRTYESNVLEKKKNNSSALSYCEIEKLLRKRRSAEYINAMQQLDVGGPCCIRQQVEKLVAAVQQEFPEISLPEMLIGLVARCYLGAPYEVHTLELTGDIIKHYKYAESLPALMEKARSIALHPGYVFIEVYADCLRAINESGDVAVIKE